MPPFRPAAQPRARRARPCSAVAASVLAVAALTWAGHPAPAAAALEASHARFRIPASARQLVVVSSPTYDPAPPGYLAGFRTFRRTSASSPWKPVFPAWQAETGSGDFRDVRREGDHATPTGVFSFGLTVYGNGADPGGLHRSEERRVGKECRDTWWLSDWSSDVCSSDLSATFAARATTRLRRGSSRSASRCTATVRTPAGCTRRTTTSSAATGGTRILTAACTAGSCTSRAGQRRPLPPGPRRSGPIRIPIGTSQ